MSFHYHKCRDCLLLLPFECKTVQSWLALHGTPSLQASEQQEWLVQYQINAEKQTMQCSNFLEAKLDFPETSRNSEIQALLCVCI